MQPECFLMVIRQKLHCNHTLAHTLQSRYFTKFKLPSVMLDIAYTWAQTWPLTAEVVSATARAIDVAHYNLNTHQPISVIFGRDVAERVCYQMAMSSHHT